MHAETIVRITPSYGCDVHTRMHWCESHTENWCAPCSREFTPINGVIITPINSVIITPNSNSDMHAGGIATYIS